MCAGRRDHHGLPQHQHRGVRLHPGRLRQPGADRRGRRAARQGPRERAELPDLAHVVVIDAAGAEPAEGDPEGWVLTLAELEERGAAYLEKNPDAITDAGRRASRADQLATLIYTSGTTGRPKGVRLPHDNWSYMAKAIRGDRADHRGGRAVPLAAARARLRQGAHLRPDRGRPRHRRRRPGRQDHREPAGGPADLHGGRPADLREGLQRRRGQGPGGRRRQVQDLPVGGRGGPRVRQGLPGQLPAHRQGLGALRARRQAQGRRHPRLRASSARPSAAGCAPASPARPRSPPTSATSSPAPASTSWRATASPSPAPPASSTRARPTAPAPSASRCPAPRCGSPTTARSCCAAPASWRATTGCPRRPPRCWSPTAGSTPATSASCPQDGYLRITDRKKDLIKTSGGKYIAPAEVEGQFKAVCPFVSNILVHGADRNFCTALIALDEPTILGWAKENGLGGKPYADVVAPPQVRRADRRAMSSGSTRASSAGRPSRSSGCCRATWTSSTAS